MPHLFLRYKCNNLHYYVQILFVIIYIVIQHCLSDTTTFQFHLSQETEIIYDVYISHSTKDSDCALSIVKFLQSQRNISVFHEFQELNENQSWQEEIFNIMGKCSRVIALLSPTYLETETCIEQYNMALCINRRSKGTFLAPFYISSVDNMPTYMSLIQYEDCR